MRLVVTTPVAVVVDADGVRHVRAEDATGAFGILPGHADLVTVLQVCVLTWRDGAGAEHHVAVRGGVLSVGGGTVAVVTREAVGEDTLQRLGAAVLDRLRSDAEAEAAARTSSARMHLAAIRALDRYLRSGQVAERPAAADGADLQP
ncbi:MAG: F0F1 ATP synthase subunit epsilon [Alphaproteobacteria bacterium]